MTIDSDSIEMIEDQPIARLDSETDDFVIVDPTPTKPVRRKRLAKMGQQPQTRLNTNIRPAKPSKKQKLNDNEQKIEPVPEPELKAEPKLDDQQKIVINTPDRKVQVAMLSSETFADLYKRIFKNPIAKLKYKNVNVSKFNTLKSLGYKPGTDFYTDVEVDVPTMVVPIYCDEVKVRLNVSPTCCLNYCLKKESYVGDWVNEVKREHGDGLLIVNGERLSEGELVGEAFDDGLVVDFVSIGLL